MRARSDRFESGGVPTEVKPRAKKARAGRQAGRQARAETNSARIQKFCIAPKVDRR